MAKKGKHKSSLKKKYIAKAKAKKARTKSRKNLLKLAWELQHKAEGKGGSKKSSKGSGKKRGKKKGKRKSGKGSVSVSVKRPGRKAARVTVAAEKRKSGKKKSKSRKSRTPRGIESMLLSLKKERERHASLAATYQERLRKYSEKLAKAEGAERGRLERQIAKLKDDLHEAAIKLEKFEATRKAQIEQAKAAEEEKRRRSRRKGKGKKKNPITGAGEGWAAAGGAALGVVLTVLPYRFVRSHKLLQGQGAPNVDAPAQGDVPNLLTAQLPVWGKFKWRGLVALAVFLGLDVGVPVAGTMLAGDMHPKTKAMFEAWLIAALTLGGGKLAVDGIAMLTKNTQIGMRLFAPENTARAVRKQSVAAQLPPIATQPDLGLPGLTGYGKAVGAGCGCSGCKAGGKCCGDKHPPSRTATGGQPVGGTPSGSPTGGTPSGGSPTGGTPTGGTTGAPSGGGGVTNAPRPKPVGVAGAEDNVVAGRFGTNRWEDRRLG